MVFILYIVGRIYGNIRDIVESYTDEGKNSMDCNFNGSGGIDQNMPDIHRLSPGKNTSHGNIIHFSASGRHLT